MSEPVIAVLQQRVHELDAALRSEQRKNKHLCQEIAALQKKVRNSHQLMCLVKAAGELCN